MAFPPSSPFLARDYPELPYPGARPGVSFVESDGAAWILRRGTDGWEVDTGCSVRPALDTWLARQDAPPLAERLPVLAYGSNASPGKVHWIRDAFGLTGPVVVLRARVSGVAAVWSAGVRERDGERPAVLAAAPGAEWHAVWLATPRQRAVLDAVEGRGRRYRLAWVRALTELDDGTRHDRVLAYTARPEVVGQNLPPRLDRSPLLVDGRFVRVADVPQAHIRRVRGVPATADGLDVVEVAGEPGWSDVDARRDGRTELTR